MTATPPTDEVSPLDAQRTATKEVRANLRLWLQHVTKVRVTDRQLRTVMHDVIERYTEACEKFAIQQELGPLREEIVHTKETLDQYLDSKCPKCSEFLHPRAKRCGSCQAAAERELYTKELLAMSDGLSKAYKQRDALRRHVELAMSALARGRREKKKGKFLRQALAILEAATTEDHPQVSKMFGSLGAAGLLGALTFPLMGYFLKRDRTPNGSTEPPTAEQAARAIP